VLEFVKEGLTSKQRIKESKLRREINDAADVEW
jgi:hypothetical protein